MLLALQSSCVAGSHSCPFRAVHDTCSARQFVSTFKLDVLTQPQTETATVEAMQKQLGDLEASHAQMSLVQSRLLSLALGTASPFTSLSRARALSRSLSPSPSLVLSLSLSLALSDCLSVSLSLSLTRFRRAGELKEENWALQQRLEEASRGKAELERECASLIKEIRALRLQLDETDGNMERLRAIVRQTEQQAETLLTKRYTLNAIS